MFPLTNVSGQNAFPVFKRFGRKIYFAEKMHFELFQEEERTIKIVAEKQELNIFLQFCICMWPFSSRLQKYV